MDDRDRADTHKHTHALAAVDGVTGAVVASARSAPRTPGIERDCDGRASSTRTGCGRSTTAGTCPGLDQALIAAGERVIRVAPKRMGESRRGERQPDESDQIDALAVARGPARRCRAFPDCVPGRAGDGDPADRRPPRGHRRRAHARAEPAAHWHLVELCPELEASLPSRSFDRQVQLDRVARALPRLAAGARVRVARELITRIRALTRDANALEAQPRGLVRAQRPRLLTDTGCGKLTPATLIGRTAGAARLATDARFARQTGTAPIPASSGNRKRHRRHRGGDRQLNGALHMIAITRTRRDPATRAYLERKIAEGKTHKQAVRCLKRHLARLLTEPRASADQAADRRRRRVGLAFRTPGCLRP